MLTDIDINFEYNTSDHNIIEEFYEPCLSNSIFYKRGVGYFTSGWLSENANGLAKFIENGGKAQYITSPILDENDLYALQGKFDKEKIDQIISSNIDTLKNNLEDDVRNLLGWLVYDGIIEFRFAIPKINLEGGDFHDKFGIFEDEENNIVTFNGSINESKKGFINYESISVVTSWLDKTGYELSKLKQNRFDRLWFNDDPNIYVYKIDELIKKKLIELKKYSTRPYSKKEKVNKTKKPLLPDWISIRDYQREAVNKWILNDGQGILSMATGSGKTFTSLYAITKVYSKIDNLPLVIIVPSKQLLEQWTEEVSLFNIIPIKCNSNYPSWKKELREAINTNKLIDSFLSIITTTATFTSDDFQKNITKLENIFLLVDEAHNFATSRIIEKYPKNTRFRLGLSATPQRHMDDKGSIELIKYFNGIVAEYSLNDAIKDGNLTEYYYYPVFVSLTTEEEDSFNRLTKRISKLSAYKNKDNEDMIKKLLIDRARIINSAKNKLPKLIDLIRKEEISKKKNNLFYCAASIDECNERYIDKVLEALRKESLYVKKFTADENSNQRKSIISLFKDQSVDGLVAIKCLDEGVDIPSIERAFIMSSTTNPKEFVQRRGRVLRKSEETNKKFAYIYDFIVIPRELASIGSEEFNIQSSYLLSEFKRYIEFSKLAKNRGSAEDEIRHLIKHYNLYEKVEL